MSEEELKREIEELPEEGIALEEGQASEQVEQPQEQEQPMETQVEEQPPMPPEVEEERAEIEERKKRLRELISTYKDVSSFVRELRDLTPEERTLVHSIVEKVLAPGEKKAKEAESKPIIIEKPVVKEVEKPYPVIPESVERIGRKAETALERIGEVEARLSRLEEALVKIADSQKDLSIAVKSITASVSENMRLRSELERIRKELEEIRRARERHLMILPKAEVLKPDGSVVREYDFHPSLKAMEKQTEFAVNKLGPALIEELRATRSDISSSINRLVTLVESIITPELRRRAPRLVEDIEETVKKLVGKLTPEERERELTELEKKLHELEQISKESMEKGGGK